MTNDVVRKYIDEELEKYGIHDISHLIFVTDRGGALVAAIPPSNRQNCIDHLINNIVQRALDISDTPEWTRLHTQSKSLVTYVKQAALQSQLSISLKKENVTRWSSTFNMLNSIQTSWDEVEALLIARNQMHRLDEIDKELLNLVIQFLKPFRDATLDMEASKYPTIHLVFLWRRKLLTHLRVKNDDVAVIEKMKEQTKRYLLNNWITKDIHKTAVFLHPFLRPIIKFSDNPDEDGYVDETENVKSLIRLQIEAENINVVGSNTNSSNTSSSSTTSSSENVLVENSRKRYTIMEDIVQYASSVVNLSPLDAEIQNYLNTLLLNVNIANFNLCEWWYVNQSKFPNLYRLALKTFCVPASSAYVESLFSRSGYLVDPKSTNLTSENINDLLFLNSCSNIINC